MALCRITHGHQSFVHGIGVTETEIDFFPTVIRVEN